jgi:hypothetical protein
MVKLLSLLLVYTLLSTFAHPLLLYCVPIAGGNAWASIHLQSRRFHHLSHGAHQGA